MSRRLAVAGCAAALVVSTAAASLAPPIARASAPPATTAEAVPTGQASQTGTAAPAPKAASQTVPVVVVDALGRPVEGALIAVGDTVQPTSADGRASVAVSPPAQLVISAPGHSRHTATWDGSGDRLYVTLPAARARAVHVSGDAAHSDSFFSSLLDLADRTSVNALVIDVKNEPGHVLPHTEVSLAHEIGAAKQRFDLAARTAQARERGLYVIVRIVTFQDPIAAPARPDMAAIDTATGKPYAEGSQRFLDPTDINAQQYALALAEESCRAGVDEVQFDYIRYPAGFPSTVRFDGGSSTSVRQATITKFFQQATDRLHPMGCATAAAIFGFITHISGEGGIGQQLESMAGAGDVVSPMVYPALYSTGWYGFDNPEDHPREVVAGALGDALRRLPGQQPKVRPWLQDYNYEPAQVRAEIDSAEEAGTGWMLWNNRSIFSEAGIPAADEVEPTPAPASVAQVRPRSGFYDVGDGSTFEAAVTWLRLEAITAGCNPPWSDEYCAAQPVTRAHMAAFIDRALALDARSDNPFTDDDGSIFEASIERLHAAGITTGCKPPDAPEADPTRYCPDEPVTRAQMAGFLFRAFG